VDLTEMAQRLEELDSNLGTLHARFDAHCGRDGILEYLLADSLGLLEVVVSRDPYLGTAAARVFEHYVRPYEAGERAAETNETDEKRQGSARATHADPSTEEAPPETLDDRRLGIGLCGGRAIRAMVKEIRQKYSCINVLPLPCAGLPQDVPFSVNTVIGMFCSKYRENDQVTGLHMPVDPHVLGHFGNEALKKIRKDMEENVFRFVDFAFGGIGSTVQGDALEKLAPVCKFDLDYFIGMGLVGDMLYQGIKESGEKMEIPELDERILGLPLHQLRDLREDPNARLRVVVGVAGGKKKARAIHAACKGRYINVLVTDEGAARELLKLCHIDMRRQR